MKGRAVKAESSIGGGGRWVSIRRRNVSRFYLRIDPALEVKYCAS